MHIKDQSHWDIWQLSMRLISLSLIHVADLQVRFNPGRQLSPTQPLAHSPAVRWGRDGQNHSQNQYSKLNCIHKHDHAQVSIPIWLDLSDSTRKTVGRNLPNFSDSYFLAQVVPRQWVMLDLPRPASLGTGNTALGSLSIIWGSLAALWTQQWDWTTINVTWQMFQKNGVCA